MKEKFQNFKKRALSLMIAVMMLILNVASGITDVKVSADGRATQAGTGTAVWVKMGNTNSQHTLKYIDGEIVFCVEPNTRFIEGEGYSEEELIEFIGSTEREYDITLIHHYGYELSGKDNWDYMYTQTMIWEYLLGETAELGGSRGSVNSGWTESYNVWKKKIQDKIDAFKNVPRFEEVTAKKGETVTLTVDDEAYLYNTSVVDNKGHDVTISGDTIRIVVSENGESGDITFKKYPVSFDENNTGISLAYVKDNSQTVAKLKINDDPRRIVVRLNTEEPTQPTRARTLKVDADTNEKLPGAEFEYCYDEDFTSSRVYTFVTDADGYTEWDTWSIQGRTVYVREKKAPVGYVKSNEVKSFVVTDGGEVELKFTNKKEEVEKTKTPARIRVEKVGTEEEKIKDAVFLFSKTEDFKEVVEKTTNEEGYTEFVEFDNYDGKVYVKEKSVPKPYIKTDEVQEVTVTDAGVFTLKFVNEKEKPKVKLKIAKIGEVLKGFNDEKITVKDKEYTVKKPIFEKEKIAGAKFKILKNGEDFKEITSIKDDFVVLENLEVGAYKVKEIESPIGYIINEEEKEVTFTAEKLEDEVLIENARDKVKLKLTKSFENGIYKKEKWAVFGLFSKEDTEFLKKDELIEVLEFTGEESEKEFSNAISGNYYIKELETSSGYNIYEKEIDVNVKDKKEETATIVNKLKKGSIKIVKIQKDNEEIKLEGVEFVLNAIISETERKEIGKFVTDENGEIRIENLEEGEYELKEIKTKEGYILDENIRVLRVTEDKITMEIVENDATKVEFSKTDITGEKELPNAKLRVDRINEKGERETVESWVSGDKPHLIERLKPGKYILTEEMAPEGYLIANEIEFEVKATGEVQKVKMVDDHTKVEFSKTDITGEKELPNAKMRVDRVNKNGERETVESWVSGDKPHLIERLKPGKYILKEEQAPDGYVIAEEIEFEVKETSEVQKVTMKDDHTKINFIKENEEGVGLKGAVFNFIEKESGKVVYTLTTNGDNHLIEKMLVVGKTYIVEEVKVPEGYEKAETFEFEVKETSEIQEIKVINKKITVPKKPKPNKPRKLVRTAIEKGYVYYIFASIFGCIVLFLNYKKKKINR